jgi:hypothetical protein
VIAGPFTIQQRIMECDTVTEQENWDLRASFPESLPAQFRLFMTVGQTFDKQGDLRVLFYKAVVARATKVRPRLYSTPLPLTMKIAI